MDTELFKPFKVAHKILKITGLWLDGNQTQFYSICGHFYRFIFTEYVLIAMLLSYEGEEIMEETVKIYFFGSLIFILYLKSWNFLLKIKNIQKCFRSLLKLLEFSADDRFKSRSHVKQKVRIGYGIYRIFIITAVANLTIGFIKMSLTHELLFKAWFPFDINANEAVFCMTAMFISLLTISIVAVGITLNMLPVIFLTFAIGLTNELAERLSKIGEDQDKLAAERQLIKCIKIHQKLKSYVEEVNGNFSMTIFVQGIVTSSVLCLNAYTMTKVS